MDVSRKFQGLFLRATTGQIRNGENFFGDSTVHWYNAIPVSARTGSVPAVKRKLKKWAQQNIPLFPLQMN